MNEKKWNVCDKPEAMLDALKAQTGRWRRFVPWLGPQATEVSQRKLLLFSCACYRHTPDFTTSTVDQRAVEMVECSADGADEDSLRAVRLKFEQAWAVGRPKREERLAAHMRGESVLDDEGTLGVDWDKGGLWLYTYHPLTDSDPWRVADNARGRYYMVQGIEAARCNLLRDVVGNPFRPSPPLPPAVLAWNDRTIPRIAQGIYEDRKLPEGTLDNSRLLILADALLDAGCEDEELLAHCRSEGQHVRGCWAIDLILGRE